MPEVVEQQQVAAPESAVLESETPATPEAPVAADTAEPEQETDEQKNERELAEQKDRSEKRARGVQKRLDELTADKYAEREARKRVERELDELRRAAQGQQQQPQQQDREPQRADFAEYEDYVAAVATHKAQKAIEARLEARERAAAEKHAQAQQWQEFQRVRAQFDQRQQAFAKDHPEYFDAVNTEDVRIPEASGAVIHTMEDGPAVVLHLARNPELARSLWGKDSHQQAIALGRISAALKSPPQVSNAPPPGKPVGGKTGDSDTPPSDMEGYNRWAKKHGI